MATPKIISSMVVHLDESASVQFKDSPISFRIIAEPSKGGQSDGWVWLTGYELDENGDAAVRREVYVYLAGIRHAKKS